MALRYAGMVPRFCMPACLLPSTGAQWGMKAETKAPGSGWSGTGGCWERTEPVFPLGEIRQDSLEGARRPRDVSGRMRACGVGT